MMSCASMMQADIIAVAISEGEMAAFSSSAGRGTVAQAESGDECSSSMRMSSRPVGIGVEQRDLFSWTGAAAENARDDKKPDASQPLPPDLDDAALIAAIPLANSRRCEALVAEAARRGLKTAVPVLESLCRRFKGFGIDRAIREQTAAVQALAMIGGSEAAAALTRVIVEQAVQGPGLFVAVSAAAQCRSVLPENVTLALLRHSDPEIRIQACRCGIRRGAVQSQVTPALLDLLGDLNAAVSCAAACALGRMGREEARPFLLHLLRVEPSRNVIESIAAVADEECIVTLGQIARSRPDLAATVLGELDGMDHERARVVANSIPKATLGPSSRTIHAEMP
jgi:HEAT repeat protein